MENNTQLLATDVQSLDTIFTLLSDRRRRYVVNALSNQEPPITLYDLVRQVSKLEMETEPEDISEETIDEVATELHHVHLPKLDNTNIINYHTEAHSITSVQTEELTSLMSFIEDDE